MTKMVCDDKDGVTPRRDAEEAGFSPGVPMSCLYLITNQPSFSPLAMHICHPLETVPEAPLVLHWMISDVVVPCGGPEEPE